MVFPVVTSVSEVVADVPVSAVVLLVVFPVVTSVSEVVADVPVETVVVSLVVSFVVVVVPSVTFGFSASQTAM